MDSYNKLITPLLVELVDTIPTGMWINKFSYSDQFPSKGNGETRNIVMEGAIQTGKDGRADIALGNKFKDDLLAKPLFKEICAQRGDVCGYLCHSRRRAQLWPLI